MLIPDQSLTSVETHRVKEKVTDMDNDFHVSHGDSLASAQVVLLEFFRSYERLA